MADHWKQTGLYWRPLGGNNIDQISGHCYQYTSVAETAAGVENTTLLVDLGKFDNHQALGIKNSAAAVPDIRKLLDSRAFQPRAILLTHSHPDHLNGIVHYLKAGYRLPPLYGGRYTGMILEQLYDEFRVAEAQKPEFHEIRDGSCLQFGRLEVETVAASHTCFDSFGFIIKSESACVYHSGDMKIDQSTYFRQPTNLRRLRQRKEKIDAVVADFYGVVEDGFAVCEVNTFKKIVQLIKKSRKPKIFLPVYVTHPEMYLIAFLAALKLRKNVVFYGNKDFYGYLKLMVDYGISFEKLAGGRIRVLYKPSEEVAALGDNYAVIGTYNDLHDFFKAQNHDSFAIITAKTFFNPLKGQLNSRNIAFTGVDEAPELQGFGHGFWGDYDYLNRLLERPLFIPTHCPCYVTDYIRELAEFCGMRLISETPRNNQTYLIGPDGARKVEEAPANWLVVNYDGDYAYFTEVWQKATSGEGLLRRTISARRCKNKFKMFLHQRKRKGLKNGSAEI